MAAVVLVSLFELVVVGVSSASLKQFNSTIAIRLDLIFGSTRRCERRQSITNQCDTMTARNRARPICDKRDGPKLAIAPNQFGRPVVDERATDVDSGQRLELLLAR